MSQNRLLIKNLTISNNNKKIIENLSFELKENYSYAIIGVGKSGKTTIIESILGYFENREISGDIIFVDEKNEKSLLSMKQKEIEFFRKKRVAVVYQNSSDIFINIETIGKQMISLLSIKTDKKYKKIKEDIIFYMNFFNIPLKLFNKYPNQIKTSTLKIFAFILVTIMEPTFLILDEPFYDLDIILRNKFIYLLKKSKENCAILITTNDILLLEFDNFIDKATILDSNGIVLEDSSTNIMNSPNPIIKEMISEISF